MRRGIECVQFPKIGFNAGCNDAREIRIDACESQRVYAAEPQ